MDKLFYSSKQKILFWVAGYDTADKMDLVHTIIEMMKLQASDFAKHVKCDVNEVRTCVVKSSSRYKGMRVYYCRELDWPSIPEDAFPIDVPNNKFTVPPPGETWTFLSWLEW